MTLKVSYRLRFNQQVIQYINVTTTIPKLDTQHDNFQLKEIIQISDQDNGLISLSEKMTLPNLKI